MLFRAFCAVFLYPVPTFLFAAAIGVLTLAATGTFLSPFWWLTENLIGPPLTWWLIGRSDVAETALFWIATLAAWAYITAWIIQRYRAGRPPLRII
jgi:hypothetical protein